MTFIKSLLSTLAVGFLGFLVVAGMFELDKIWGLENLGSQIMAAVGWVILTLGAVFRFWPTYLFYQKKMRIISRRPQQHLITSGPYRFSRNPLYLAFILILLGGTLIAGSISAIVLTLIIFWGLNLWVKIEEKQLEAAFGDEYRQYKKQTKRWL